MKQIVMNWLTFFVLGVSVLAVPQGANDACFRVNGNLKYSGSPADVVLPTASVLVASADSVLAVKQWFDGGTDRVQFIETSDGVRWKDAGHLFGATTPSSFIAILRASGSIVLFRQNAEGSLVERSLNGGHVWTNLRFDVDGQSARKWVQSIEATQGSRLVPHFAAVLPGNPATVYSTFRIWVPEKQNAGKFSHWRDVDGMYVSLNAGDSWTLLSRELIAGSPFGIVKSDSPFMVGQTKAGLVLSHDGGRGWTTVGEQDALNGSVQLTGRNAKLAELAAKGIELNKEFLKGVPIRIYQVELSHFDEKLIFLRTNIGLIVSRDAGRTWNVCPIGGKTLDVINALILPPDVPHEVVVSTNAGGNEASRIFLSRDDGRSYTTIYTMSSAADIMREP